MAVGIIVLLSLLVPPPPLILIPITACSFFFFLPCEASVHWQKACRDCIPASEH